MSQSLQQTKIAKRYVNALFASVTTKTEIATMSKDIADVMSMVNASTNFQTFIKSPLLSVNQHKAGIEKLAKKAKLSKPVTNLLMILAENRRLNVLPAISHEVENYLAKESGTVPVRVATARALSAADQKKLGADLKAAIGNDISMQTFVDESLIGGIVLQVESTLIDGSIKTKLDRLERQLTSKAA